MPVKPKPDGTSTVTPYLLTSNVGKLIEFLQMVFDAKEAYRMTMPDGAIMHAQVHIGESSIMMGMAPPGHDVISAMLYVYVPDVDAAYRRAINAGATSVRGLTDEFYGDRVGAVKDTDGNQWYIATHKEDVPTDELAKRAAAAREKPKA
jgi:uncharacterized glyoxalase superfamily protein PhnB